MKNSGGKWKNITKYILVILVACAALFGLTQSKTISKFAKEFFAAGDRPVINKGRTPNNDGTYKLSLSVKGDAEKKVQKVNVIVIVDRSGSMGENSGTTAVTYTPSNDQGNPRYGLIDGEYVLLERRGQRPNRTYWYNGTQYTGQRYIRSETNQTRMEATKAAVNNLAENLLANNGQNGNPDDTVEMALVSFSTNASTNVEKTTSYSTFSSAVNGLNANGGTNWEAALQEANEIDFGDNDQTFVIFFSDGSPTFHSTNGGYNNWNQQYGVYGSGQEQEPNMSRSYTQATDDAQTLATKVGTDKFYTIFAYGTNTGANYMTNLTSEAGAPAGNNYSASDTAGLQQAFAEILEKIEMSGIADAVINDGTTNQVSTSTGVVELLEVDENSYKYYKNGEEWTDPENDDEIAAHLVNGVVKWDLSKLGVLENDVTYEVTFDVYPSQTTYDYIADLENGVIEYSDLPDGVQKYLHQTGTALSGYSYSLDTNTEDVTLTYDDTRDEAGPQTIDFNKLNSVATTSDSISISKEWDNSIDTRTERPVSVRILKTDDDGEFQNYCFTTSCTAELNQSNNWSLSDIHIATGLARLSGNKLTVLDTGHDYKFDELGSEAYNWELETETVHPMLINGVLTKLILVEEDAPDMGSDSYKTIDGKDYYKLDNGKVYVKSNDGANIKAENHRRSNLNIMKNVTGENANPNDKFEFTIKVTQKDENGDAIADDTTTINDDIWFSICDTAIDSTCVSPDSLVKDDSLVTGAQKEMRNGAWTGYYYTTNDSEVTINLKDKYNIRFTNLVSNTDFSVVESNMNNYSLENIETTSGFESKNDSKNIEVNTKKITGHIGESNTVYQVEYTNKNTIPETTNVTVTKIWDDDSNSAGLRPEKITIKVFDGTEEVDSQEITGSATGETWSFTSKDLPKYRNGQEIEYTVSEEFETTPADKYDQGDPEKVSTNEYKITNSYEPETTNVTVTKIWDDDSNSAGLRPEKITIKVFDGTEEVDSQEITGSATGETWSFTSKDLPKYRNGQEIEYTVSEEFETTPADKYDQGDPEKVSTNEYKITNSYEPETVTVPVKKTWDDASNQDGLRTDELIKSVTFNLYGVDKETPVASHTFDPDEDCKIENECNYLFKEDNQGNSLPKYANGQEINYTVKEVFSSDYYSSEDPNDEDGNGEIINSHTPFQTTVTVKKIWNDDNNRDNARENIDVVLTAGKLPDLYNIKTLKESNSWTESWTELQRYIAGQEITYTVTELTTLTRYNTEGAIDVTEPDEDHYKDNVVKFEITNNRIFETVEIPIKKVWQDAGNQDGKRKNVTFELYADGNLVNSYEFENKDCTGNICTSKFTTDSKGAALPKYKHGEVGVEVEYTIKETNLPTGYDNNNNEVITEADGTLVITNSYEPSTITIPVKKVWSDANDQDGIRDEETITFELYGAGGAKVAEYTFPTNQCTNNECTYTFTEDKDGNALPEYQPGAQGQKINYRIEETGNSKQYTASDMTTENGYLVIKNTHNPEPTTVPVKKVWEDANNQDGIREYVTFELYGAAGAKVAEHTFEAKDCTGNICTFEFKTDGDGITGKELPKYEPGQSGQEVQYTIKETGLPTGYTNNNGEVTTDDAGNLTITNTHTPAKVNVPVTKQWVDANNSQNTRPNSIEVQLYADNQPVEGKTATVGLDENGDPLDGTTVINGNSWKYEFTDLEKFEAGKVGHQIDYTIRETVPTGYTVSYDHGTINDGTTIINTANETIKKDIPVKKVWDDLTNIEGIRPNSVTFKLVGRVGGKQVPKDPYILTINKPEGDTNNTAEYWEGVFKDVQQFDNGNLINYTLEEVVMDISNDRYSVEIVGNDYTDPGDVYKNGYVVTNKSRPATIDFTATKKWADNDDNDGKRPTEIKVQLMNQNTGQPVGDEVTLSADDWSYTWEGLDQFEEGKQGVKIKYYIVETTDVEGYNPQDFDFETNSITNTHEPITISYKVTKVWDDFDNQDGKRPKSITVRLVGKVNGQIVVPEKVQEINSSNNWTYEFKNLPKYYQKQLIQYTITEDKVSLYDTEPITQVDTKEETKELSNSVTNKHKLIPYDNTGKITVKKIWKDKDNKFNTRPKSITIHLFADGVEIKKAVLTAKNNWTYTFTGLNKYKKGAVGVEVVYTITEDSVKGYSSSINGFEITNTMNKTEIVPPKTGIESTNNSDNTLFYIITFIITTLGVTTIAFRNE